MDKTVVTPAENRATIPLKVSKAGAESRREYSVQFIQAGPVRQRDGTFAEWDIAPTALINGVSKLDGVAVFVDHADWFDYPSVRNLAAVTFAPWWDTDNQAIGGGIRLYSHADWLRSLLDELIADADAGREVPDVGLSIVFYGKHEVDERTGRRTTIALDHVESADIVFGPAAEGRIKEILSKTASGERSVNVRRTSADGNERSDNPGERPQQLAERPDNPGERPQQLTERPDNPGERPQQCTERSRTKGERTMDESKVNGIQPVGSKQAGNGAVESESPPTKEGMGDLLQKIEQLTGVVADEQSEREEATLRALSGQVEALTEALVQRESRRAVQGMGHAPSDRVLGYLTGRDEVERFGGVVDWMFGVPEAEIPDPQYRRADMIYWALTGDYEFRGVFDPERVQLANATTTTLPALAVNAMNKVLLSQFSALTFWRWYERITYVTPNDGSVNDMQWITFGGIGDLPTVGEGGAYTELTVGDVKESSSFVKKGGFVGITREMIKNSDIMKIQAVPRALAMAAVRTRSAAVSGIFTSAAGVGPTLSQDSKALFHADHGNLDVTAFDQSAWQAARTECFKQAEVNSGKALGVFPRYALVPAELYDAALAAFGYGEGYPTSYNVYVTGREVEDPRPVPLVVPDWSDANNWAYMVDPVVFPVIQMSFSQAPGGGSHPVPELFSVTSESQGLMFTNDVLPIKVRDEFAVGVNGPRGIGKRNVV